MLKRDVRSKFSRYRLSRSLSSDFLSVSRLRGWRTCRFHEMFAVTFPVRVKLRRRVERCLGGWRSSSRLRVNYRHGASAPAREERSLRVSLWDLNPAYPGILLRYREWKRMPRRENGQNSQTMRVTLFVRESFRIKTVDIVDVEGYLLVYNSINRYGQSLLRPVFHS